MVDTVGKDPGYVFDLSDGRALEVALAGGKGSSLAALIAGGLAVPPGFVVSSAALADCVDGAELKDAAAAKDAEAAQALVRGAGRVPAEALAAYEELGGSVAVRSSACAEDGSDASYAGQQETFLGVEGREAVERAIVECWASFFTDRALAYRERMGSLEDLGMAVVVQRMIEPDKAGVLFTRDPIHRRRDRMMVEAVPGRGEQLVSGEVTPDHYVTDRSGKVVRATTPHGDVLTEADLSMLAQLALRAEELFEGPQDVEWVIRGSDLYLVQSRPITTL